MSTFCVDFRCSFISDDSLKRVSSSESDINSL